MDRVEKHEQRAAAVGKRYIPALLLLLFIMLLSFSARADNINVALTYGYQNTAKAGRILPLRIDMENTMPETFTGYAHIYLAESGSSVCEYRYRALVEAESETSLRVNIYLGAGVNQILVAAEGRDGTVYGSKRIGLDVSSSDGELIIGILSERSNELSYLNGVSLNDGLLRSRTVSLDPKRLPEDEAELEQLDLILISDYELSSIKPGEAEVLNRWIERGGVMLLGTGIRGEQALAPYYSELLNIPLRPESMELPPGDEDGGYSIVASSVYLKGGRERLFSNGKAMLSTVARGAGLIGICGYDLCELQRYGTEQPSYAEELLAALLGESRIQELSPSATEKGLRDYWDMEALMNQSDLSKLPRAGLYMLLFTVYILLIGPVLRILLKQQGGMGLYRPIVVLLSAAFSLLVWIMGVDTRINGSFITYSKWKEYAGGAVDETTLLNLRSSYRDEYGIDVKAEYSIYPLMRGNDYSGDISQLRAQEGVAHTSVEYLIDRSEIRIREEEPFTARYFQLHNKMPASGEGFEGSVSYFNGLLYGSISNKSNQTLYDAAVLLYGRLIRIGRLEAGETVELGELSVETVPAGNSLWIASRIAGGNSGKLLEYYLSKQLSGYFSNARLIGFFHDDELGFSDDGKLESYGITMASAVLPLSTSSDGEEELTALSMEPEVETGDYESNSISSLGPAVVAYSLLEEELRGLRFETLSLPASISEESFSLLPFQGSVSLYNYLSGGYDSIEYLGRSLSAEELRPYLNEERLLRIRYTPRDLGLSAFTRLYLPVPVFTVEESDAKGLGRVPVIQAESGLDYHIEESEAAEGME